MGYVLEVVKFITKMRKTKMWHVGYMDARFKTKKDACSYYDRHNTHMRSLNAFNTWTSDWDPNTHLLYIVRHERRGIIGPKLSTFTLQDMPVHSHDVSGNGFMTTYKWLK